MPWGVTAVSAYAAMSYAVYTFDYIFQGMCDGIQPIISYCRGAVDSAQERRAVTSAGWILGCFSMVCILLTPALIRFFPGVLGVSEDAKAMMRRGFLFCTVSYPLKAAVKFLCFYILRHRKTGDFPTFWPTLTPWCLPPLFLWLLSRLWRVDGVCGHLYPRRRWR